MLLYHVFTIPFAVTVSQTFSKQLNSYSGRYIFINGVNVNVVFTFVDHCRCARLATSLARLRLVPKKLQRKPRVQKLEKI